MTTTLASVAAAIAEAGEGHTLKRDALGYPIREDGRLLMPIGANTATWRSLEMQRERARKLVTGDYCSWSEILGER